MKTSTTDALAQELFTIESTCTSRHIALFYGDIDDAHQAPIVQWHGQASNNLDTFTQVLQKAAPTLLIVSIERYDEESDDDVFQLVQHHKDRLSGESLQAYEQAQKELNVRDGLILTYTFSFFHQRVCYSFERNAEWHTYFDTFTDAYDLRSSDERPEEELNEEPSEEEIEVILALLQNEAYQKARLHGRRNDIVRKALEKAGIFDLDRFYRITVEAHDRFPVKCCRAWRRKHASRCRNSKNKAAPKL